LDDQISEQEKLRAESTVAAQNEDLATKSKAMEEYLAAQQRFHQGASGRFASDTVATQSGSNWEFHFEIAATVPPYEGTRVRQLEEIVADINALQLNIRFSQLDPATRAKGGCTFAGIRPYTDSGRIDLIDPTCIYSVTLWLLPSGPVPGSTSSGVLAAGSAQVAEAIKAGRLAEADTIWVELDNSRTAEVITFAVKRTERFNW
jgi:hypothetical protein